MEHEHLEHARLSPDQDARLGRVESQGARRCERHGCTLLPAPQAAAIGGGAIRRPEAVQSSGGPHRHPSGRLHAERIARGQRTRERLYRAARDERCVVAWGVEAQDPERLGGGLSAQEAFGGCRRVGHVRVDGSSVAPSFVH